MAAAYFNHLSGGKGRAISAGTQPSQMVNLLVIQVMGEEEIDISQNKPALLTGEMMQESERVISMGCIDEAACPVRLVPMTDWRLPDPEGKSLEAVRQIRDRIKKLVNQLIEEL